MPRLLGSFVILFAGVALGLAIAHWNAPDQSKVPRLLHELNGPTSTDSSRNHRPIRTVPGEPSDAAAQSHSAPSASTSTSPATTDLEAELRALAAEAAAVTGTGKFHGTVRTPTGEPVAGVRVKAEFGDEPGAQELSELFSKNFEDYLRDLARQYGRVRSAEREAITNDAGEYSIGGLPDHEYAVSAHLDGFQVDKRERRRDRFRPDQRIDFFAYESLAVTLTVLLPDGSTARDATIEATRDEDIEEHGWTANLPSIALPSGTYMLKAKQGVLYKSAPQLAMLTRETIVTPLVLSMQLQTSLRVKIRVSDPEEDLSKAYVMLLPSPEGDAIDPSAWDRDEPISVDLQAGETIEDVAPGRYQVGAARMPGVPDAVVAFDIKEGLNELEITLPALSIETSIVVQLHDAAGAIIDSADFFVGWDDDDGSNDECRFQSVRKHDGSWWLAPEPERLFPAGGPSPGRTYSLAIQTEHHGSRRIAILPGKHQEVRIQFGEPATVEVSMNSNYESVPGVRYSISLWSPGSDSKLGVATATTSSADGRLLSDGSCTLGPLECGAYEFTLTAHLRRPDAEADMEVLTQTTTVAPGENKLVLQMPHLHEVSIDFPTGDPKSVAFLRSIENSDWCQSRLDDNRCATFTYLSTGDYRVKHNDAPMLMKIALPGPDRITFAPNPLDALRVSIGEKEQYLAATGFLEGDLIIGMDGVTFESRPQIANLFVAARERVESTFTVLRAGTTIEITASAKTIEDRTHLGGWIEPTSR